MHSCHIRKTIIFINVMTKNNLTGLKLTIRKKQTNFSQDNQHDNYFQSAHRLDFI